MGVVKVTGLNLKKHEDMIPKVFVPYIMKGSMTAVAGYFSDEYAGIMIYDTEFDMINLRCIYVDPAYRRLGVAEELFLSLPDMRIAFSYEAICDRSTLEPFFDAMGVETERLYVPLADFNLDDALTMLSKKRVNEAEECGTFLDEFDRSLEDAAEKWFKHGFAENGLIDGEYIPGSIFYITEGAITGGIILRKEEPGIYDYIMSGASTKPEDIINIDYLFCEIPDKKVMPGMMNRVIRRLKDEYGKGTRIHGFLMNESSKKIYRSLFGEADVMIPVVTTV